MGGIKTYKGTVNPGQCDLMGHMNVFWYTAKFDEASWSFLSLIGIQPQYLRESKRRMAGAKQTLCYLKELFAGDPIIISTTLDHIGTTSLRLTHRMYREWESDPVATAELVAVHVDSSTRRGCEFPAVLKSRMTAFLAGASNRSAALSAVGDPP